MKLAKPTTLLTTWLRH